MRLASIQVNSPRSDEEAIQGNAVIVSQDHTSAAPVPNDLLSGFNVPSLQWVVNHWDEVAPRLKEVSSELNAGKISSSIDLSTVTFKAPITQAPEFLDGSAFISHIERLRKARGSEPPETLETDPLMYQGTAARFNAYHDNIRIQDDSHGVDLESEIAVIVKHVAEASPAELAAEKIVLVTMMNDVSLRGLIPTELGKQFGFLNGKPISAFAPIAITVDELEEMGAWKDGRLHADVLSFVNDSALGSPNAGTMHFSFPQLIAHAAKTRDLFPGTIIGSGTISEPDESKGGGCLAETRTVETIHQGEPKTPFLKAGDTVRIEALFDKQNLFGSIKQEVVPYTPPQ